MRYLMIAAAAAFLLMPASAPATACGAGHSAQAATTDLAAQTKQAETKAVKKTAKKRVAKKKAPKVEYMRAAPM